MPPNIFYAIPVQSYLQGSYGRISKRLGIGRLINRNLYNKIHKILPGKKNVLIKTFKSTTCLLLTTQVFHKASFSNRQ